MNLFNPKGWDWWQQIRSSLYPSEEDARFLGDPNVSPMQRDFEYMEPEDLTAFRHDERWGQMFDPLDLEGFQNSLCGNDSTDSHSGAHHNQAENCAHHEHEHGIHDIELHDHHSLWDSESHQSDWGSSWD